MTLSSAFGDCGERNLDAFLANFLRDARRALREQARRVAAFRILGDALFDHAFQLAEEGESAAGRGVSSPKARRGADVAHRPVRTGGDQQGVAIAIRAHFDEVEDVARGLALHPQPLLRAAEEHARAAA